MFHGERVLVFVTRVGLSAENAAKNDSLLNGVWLVRALTRRYRRGIGMIGLAV